MTPRSGMSRRDDWAKYIGTRTRKAMGGSINKVVMSAFSAFWLFIL
jgi:hypothetical protein